VKFKRLVGLKPNEWVVLLSVIFRYIVRIDK
jgi:hypothetical protein